LTEAAFDRAALGGFAGGSGAATPATVYYSNVLVLSVDLAANARKTARHGTSAGQDMQEAGLWPARSRDPG
jgi:hypothetical protein